MCPDSLFCQAKATSGNVEQGDSYAGKDEDESNRSYP